MLSDQCSQGQKLTHQALISNGRVACQMEQHGHIVFVIRSIEASDIDSTRTLAISESTGIE